MTDIEQKALALLNEVLAERRLPLYDEEDVAADLYAIAALCRAIERDKAFRQEVSDAVESLCNTVFVYEKYLDMRDMLRRRFIIAKSDPLAEAIKETHDFDDYDFDIWADQLRAAVEKRGGKIVWGEG